jgi:hypothetical protein
MAVLEMTDGVHVRCSADMMAKHGAMAVRDVSPGDSGKIKEERVLGRRMGQTMCLCT